MSERNSITTKIKKLDEMVEWFYGEDFSLDAALEKYKAAAELAKEIEKDLSELKNQISVVNKDFTKEA